MGLMTGNNKVCITERVQGKGIGIPRGVNSSGVYGSPTESFTFSLPNNATDIGTYAMYQAFYGCTSITSADLSSLVTISGSNAMYMAFYGCTSLTSADFSSLVTISGSTSMRYVFQGCSSLTSVDLSLLQVISGSSAMKQAFYNCSSLRTLSFPSLNADSFGSYTNQFNNMLSGCSNVTVHFPSNLQSVIGNWTDVTNGFGGTNTTVLYDLPATSQ